MLPLHETVTLTIRCTATNAFELETNAGGCQVKLMGRSRSEVLAIAAEYFAGLEQRAPGKLAAQ